MTFLMSEGLYPPSVHQGTTADTENFSQVINGLAVTASSANTPRE